MPTPISDYLIAVGDSQVTPTTTEVMYPSFVAAAFYDPKLSWIKTGVNGQTSTQAADGYLAAQPFYRSGCDAIFDMGINNFSNTVPAVNLILADIARAVAGCASGRYRVMAILPRADGTTNIGSPKRATLDDMNATLAATYPGRFIDRLPFFIAANNGSPGDLADVAIGVIPQSLRKPADAIHRNQAGERVEAAVTIASIEGGW